MIGDVGYDLRRVLPSIDEEVQCPACKSGALYDNRVALHSGMYETVTVALTEREEHSGSIYRLVQHLNDTWQWTREQIADWLETLDVDLTFPTEPPPPPESPPYKRGALVFDGKTYELSHEATLHHHGQPKQGKALYVAAAMGWLDSTTYSTWPLKQLQVSTKSTTDFIKAFLASTAQPAHDTELATLKNWLLRKNWLPKSDSIASAHREAKRRLSAGIYDPFVQEFLGVLPFDHSKLAHDWYKNPQRAAPTTLPEETTTDKQYPTGRKARDRHRHRSN